MYGLRAAGQQQFKFDLCVPGPQLQLVNSQLRRRGVNGTLQPGEIHLSRVCLGGEFLDRQVKARIIGSTGESDLHIRNGGNAFHGIEGQPAAAVLYAKAPQLDVHG